MYIQSQIIHFHKIKERLLHVWHSKQFPICLKHLHYPWSARLCLPVPSQKMKFTKRDACWVLNCALINLRFMSLVSTFNDTQRLTRMIQWSISLSLNVLMSFRTHDQCLYNQYMQCHIVRFFRLISPSWNSEHWPLCGESLGLVSRFFPFLSSLLSADQGHTRFKYSHKFHNSQTLNSFQIKCTRPPAGWDTGWCLMPGWHLRPRITRNTIRGDQESEGVTTDKAREAHPDTNTWDKLTALCTGVASVLFPPTPRQSQCNLISQLISSFR